MNNATTLNKATHFFKEKALYFVLLLLLVVIVSKDTSFLSLNNLSNILTQSSVRIIIALGVAGLIVTQGTDLSVGRQVGLAAVVMRAPPDAARRARCRLGSGGNAGGNAPRTERPR